MFKLFERQPNWTLRQLIQETDQPEVRKFKLYIFSWFFMLSTVRPVMYFNFPGTPDAVPFVKSGEALYVLNKFLTKLFMSTVG